MGCQYISRQTALGEDINGRFEYRICFDNSPIVDPKPGETWESISASSNLQKFTDEPNSKITINFSPKEHENLALPDASYFTDVGEPYGSKGGGKTFGWNCLKSTECHWCCNKWCDRPCCVTPTWENTFTRVDEKCPDEDKESFWELAVPNGIYNVISNHNERGGGETHDVSGCNVEGVKIWKTKNKVPATTTASGVKVEVKD